MADLRLRIELSLSHSRLRQLLVLALLAGSAQELSSESVTLTTYYPAPSGVYTQMITTGGTYLARDNGRVGIRTTSPATELDVRGGARVSAGLTVSAEGLDVTGGVTTDSLVTDSLTLSAGTPAPGMVLTANAAGQASWQYCTFAPD